MNLDPGAYAFVPDEVLPGIVPITSRIPEDAMTADLLGRHRFGATAGKLAIPFMFGFAVGPTIAALVWELGGYDMVIGLALLSVLLGLGAVVAAARVE